MGHNYFPNGKLFLHLFQVQDIFNLVEILHFVNKLGNALLCRCTWVNFPEVKSVSREKHYFPQRNDIFTLVKLFLVTTAIHSFDMTCRKYADYAKISSIKLFDLPC